MIQDSSHPGREGRSIRVSLAALIATSVVLSAVLTLGLLFSAAQDAAATLIGRIMDDIGERVRTRAAVHLRDAEQALAVVRELHASGAFTEEGRRTTNRFLITLMEKNPAFEDLFIATPAGHLDGISRMPDGTLSVRAVRNQGDRIRTEWRHSNPEWSVLHSDTVQSRDAGYDPRTRPWYKAALERGGAVWSEVYLFSTSRRPGITCSLPLYGDDTSAPGAIVGINIGLDDLSHLLARACGDEIDVVVLDAAERIVAMPLDPGESLPLDADGNLVTMARIGRPRLAALIRDFGTAEPLSGGSEERDVFVGRFSSGGEQYCGRRQSLADRTPWDWTVLVVVPERIFMQRIHDRIVLSVLLSLLLIALAVAIGLLLARRIAAPMARIASDMKRVERFDLSGDPAVESRILEIQTMARAHGRMKAGLRSFRKYVPADLVRDLVRLGQEAELGGERREVTVYFSDIAGFTSISERMDPEELVRHLSVYFSDLGRLFGENRGTIDKYIGDAIMAFWNAPERVENHAELACRTALRVQERLAELNARWRSQGRPELGTRCGLATGEVIVGNMGSEERLNYTVIGDTANLASRLEGLNKHYGTRIMIAESTRQRVQNLFRTRWLDNVAVKGKARPVAVYELVAEAGPLPAGDEAFIAAYESALGLHVERRWQEAIERLEEALAIRPGDLASVNLRDRCENYRKSPPPADWNGSHVMESK